METCSCGASLRTFWIWRDAQGVLHASAFEPTAEPEQSLYASTARDALVPMTGNRAPKHDVRSVHDASQEWKGRCADAMITVQAAL